MKKRFSCYIVALAAGWGLTFFASATPPDGATALPGKTGGGGGSVANAGGTVTATILVGDPIGGPVTNLTTGGVQANTGPIGQLYDTVSLAVFADPSAVVEGDTTQLTAVATMDDDTLVDVAGVDAFWNVVNGPVDAIDGNGVALAGQVFLNSPATVEGEFDGVTGELGITILNQNSGSPPGPGPDLSFTSLEFDPIQAGLYQGLLTDGSGNVVGTITGFKLGSTGAFSGKVIFNGRGYKLKGTLDEFGAFTGQILRRGLDPLDVALQIGETDGGGRTLRGTVTGDSIVGNADIAQAPYHARNNPAPEELAKQYTFLIPSSETGNTEVPGGDGYGAVTVSTSGKITAVGKTGDGMKFSSRGFLTGDDQWHLYQALYRGQGQIAGVVDFRDVPDVSDLDGQLKWVKNPNERQKSYPNGFDLDQWLVGSEFVRPLKGERALGELADQEYNARLSLAGNTIPDEGDARTISWKDNNVLTFYGPEKLAGKVNVRTGLIGGSYHNPFTLTKLKFGGAVLQKQGIAGGNFLYLNEAGYLLVEPGTEFYYPGREEAGLLELSDVPGAPALPPNVDVSPFDEAAAGVFNGVVTMAGGLTGGIENVKVNSRGAISGKIWVEGTLYAFKGALDAATGLAEIEIPRKNLPPVSLTLQLVLADGTTDGFQLAGSIDVDGVVHDLDAQRRPVFDKLNRSPDEGRYTIAMRAPDGTDPAVEPGGDGYGSVSVHFKGTCKGLLTLPDLTKASMAGHISRNSEWSVHRSLYKRRGFIAGKLTFRDETGVSDVDGDCRWFKQGEVPKTKSYVDGFDLTRTLIGGNYTPPAKGENAFAALDDSLYNAWMRLSGPDMAPLVEESDVAEVDRTITWNSGNKIVYYGPDVAKITFNTKSGLTTGVYVDKAAGAKVKFGGALLQEQSLVTGSYLSGGQSGIFVISPRTPDP